MVEPVDAGHKRVTFLWRGASRNVFILGSPAGDHDPLFRLGDSDVWFRSYVVPADTLMQYKLAPDVPQVTAARGSSGGRFWSAPRLTRSTRTASMPPTTAGIATLCWPSTPRVFAPPSVWRSRYATEP
jgi:hypothetical protein